MLEVIVIGAAVAAFVGWKWFRSEFYLISPPCPKCGSLNAEPTRKAIGQRNECASCEHVWDSPRRSLRDVVNGK